MATNIVVGGRTAGQESLPFPVLSEVESGLLEEVTEQEDRVAVRAVAAQAKRTAEGSAFSATLLSKGAHFALGLVSRERWVLFQAKSTTDRGIRNLLAVLGRRADVADVHPHRFRHDTARRLVEAVDLPTVAALLGHSRLDTIRIYAQPDEAAHQRAAESLEKA